MCSRPDGKAIKHVSKLTNIRQEKIYRKCKEENDEKTLKIMKTFNAYIIHLRLKKDIFERSI